MNSRLSNASTILFEFGWDNTGLPAMVMKARIWPSPGVRISSCSAPGGSVPQNSGSPLTRVCQRFTGGTPSTKASLNTSTGIMPTGNITPPGRSTLPVNTLIASCNQLDKVPKLCVQVPNLPYQMALSAAANCRASWRITSAGTVHAAVTRSGGYSFANVRMVSMPRTLPSRWRKRIRFSANSTLMTASRK